MFTRKLSFTPIKYPKAESLGISTFPYYEHDSNGNETYYENVDGFWIIHEYDSYGCITYYEDSFGRIKRYNTIGELIYYRSSLGDVRIG